MIFGLHTILYSSRAEAVRAFFRDILKFSNVDAGHGWLMFAAPPGELAVHPSEEAGSPELYLMCSDIKKTVAELENRGVEFTEPISEERWGLLTRLKLPDGEKLGLYEPRHKMAIKMKSSARRKSRARKIARKSNKVSRSPR